MAKLRDAAGTVCENGAQRFAIGNQARGQNSDGRYRPVNIGFPINGMRFDTGHDSTGIMTQKILMDAAVRRPDINRP